MKHDNNEIKSLLGILFRDNAVPTENLCILALQAYAEHVAEPLEAENQQLKADIETLESTIAALHAGTDFQNAVYSWCVECFGATTADDLAERNWRFLEESLELVQSLGGSKEDAQKMLDYTYSREKGEPAQEVGGVMITLAALCAANDISMTGEGRHELSRINRPEIINKIRGKHAAKHHKSRLPGDYRYAQNHKASES